MRDFLMATVITQKRQIFTCNRPQPRACQPCCHADKQSSRQGGGSAVGAWLADL